jgi:hypothetical protein
MRRLLALLLLAVALPCAAFDYTPSIYPLREGLVPPVHVAGTVSVVNAQPNDQPVIVYKYGTKLWGSMHAVTQVMADQTRLELKLDAAPPQPGDKSIALRVDSLLSKYKFFSWSSKIVFEATLGDGTVLKKEVPHASGGLLQDLNGAIAEAVMVLLNDPAVRAYLEAPVAPGADAATQAAVPATDAPTQAAAPATDAAAQPATPTDATPAPVTQDKQ